ncbi:MAG: hypothetical protein AAFX90_10250 [Pseudomonadota bacterium]
MKPHDLSDNAVKFWACFFLTGGNTLRFGGDHAEMEITPWARDALNELIKVGAVKTIEPDDQWPGREHYGSTGMGLRPLAVERGGGDAKAAFDWLMSDELVTFVKKEQSQ